MITNEHQYHLTRFQIAQFEQALQQYNANNLHEIEPLHPLLQRAEREALQSQLDSLQAELNTYESLQNGQHSFILQSFAELPQTLIRARIASGITQKQLANRLGLQERQIHHYEATEYASANLQRILNVLQALGLEMHESITLTETFRKEG